MKNWGNIEKRSKSSVHYSLGTTAEHCGNCEHYQRDHDSCIRVQGEIQARMWCSLWSARNGAAKVDRRWLTELRRLIMLYAGNIRSAA